MFCNFTVPCFRLNNLYIDMRKDMRNPNPPSSSSGHSSFTRERERKKDKSLKQNFVRKKWRRKSIEKRTSDETRCKPRWKLNDLISEIEFEKSYRKESWLDRFQLDHFTKQRSFQTRDGFFSFYDYEFRIYFTLLVPSPLLYHLNASGNVYHRLFVERQIKFVVCDSLN